MCRRTQAVGSGTLLEFPNTPALLLVRRRVADVWRTRSGLVALRGVWVWVWVFGFEFVFVFASEFASVLVFVFVFALYVFVCAFVL